MTSSSHAEAEKSDVLHADQLEKPAHLLPTTDSDENTDVPAGYFPVTAEEIRHLPASIHVPAVPLQWPGQRQCWQCPNTRSAISPM